MWVPGWVDTSALRTSGTTWNFLFGWHGKHSDEPTFLTVDFLHDNALMIKSRSTPRDLHVPGIRWWEFMDETTHYTTPMPRDQWIDFVFHFRIDERPLAAGGQGILDVWINGTQVVDYDGPLGFYHQNVTDIAGYSYVGTYSGREHNRAFYYDEIRIGDAAAGYAGVSPETFGRPRPNPPVLVSQ